MSLRATSWAWKVRAPSPTSKLVLVALAEHANESGLCWPSVARLVETTGLSERAVRTNIATLAAADLVKVNRGQGRCKTTRYELCIKQWQPNGADAAPNGGGNGAPRAPKGFGERVHVVPEKVHVVPEKVHVGPEKVQEVHPEPSRTLKNRQELSDSTARGARLPDEWWPSSVDQDFARDLGLDPTAIVDEFRDYWRAVPGARGRKLDWSATFRNRCRDVAARHRSQQPNQQPSKLAWMIEPGTT